MLRNPIFADIVDIPPYQFNAVLVDTDNRGKATSVKSINLIIERL